MRLPRWKRRTGAERPAPEHAPDLARSSEVLRRRSRPNAGDETPGEVSYTSLYTQFDELVQPVTPVPTAALEWGQDNRNVANILLQDVCPNRFVDHVTIGTTDRLSFELALDAILNQGPANLERAGGAALCGLDPIVPDQLVYSGAVQAMLAIMAKEEWSFDPHWTQEEPPLKPYAQ